jgi:hypothetical protein
LSSSCVKAPGLGTAGNGGLDMETLGDNADL